MDAEEKVITIGITGFCLVVALIIIFNITGLIPSYSEGERTGNFYKFSQKGIFFKSWEGEMYLGGVSSTGGKNPTLQMDTFDFSIPSAESTQKADIIAKAKKCSTERLECTVVYKQWLIGPISVGTEYIVQDIILPQ